MVLQFQYQVIKTNQSTQYRGYKTENYSQWCCEEIFHTPTLTIGNQFYPILPASCAIQMGLLSIYQHKQDVFGWICITSYPNLS